MIVHPKPSFWQLFGMVRLSILPRIGWQLAGAIGFSVAVVLVHGRWPAVFHSWSVAPFTLLGVALSIFLSFRNSACYDRWWEARRQLGALIGEMRSFARLAVTSPGADRGRRERIVRLGIGYVYALMAHLRDAAPSVGAEPYAAEIASGAALRNRPDALLRRIAAEYGAMLAEGEIGEQVYVLWETRLSAFAAIQVACERIRGTPTPFTYTLLIHRTAYAFCFLLPCGLVSTMGWGTPVFCALVAYAFFGLDALGDELEEPFGPSPNALPLDAMARTIEISLLEALNAKSVPEPLLPVASVLR